MWVAGSWRHSEREKMSNVVHTPHVAAGNGRLDVHIASWMVLKAQGGIKSKKQVKYLLHKIKNICIETMLLMQEYEQKIYLNIRMDPLWGWNGTRNRDKIE